MPQILANEVIDSSCGVKCPTFSLNPKFIEAIQLAQLMNSTIPYYSAQAVRKSAEKLLENHQDIQNIIVEVEIVLQMLKHHAAKLREWGQLVKEAASEAIRPFPPIPTDIAAPCVALAAEMDISTAKSLTFVSKQVQQWADPYVWNCVTVNSNKLAGRLSVLLQQPGFITKRAGWIRTFASSGQVETECLPLNMILALPKLKSFSHWNRRLPCPKRSPDFPSTLRRISCCPHLLNADSVSNNIDFNLPVFQHLTHLDVRGSTDIGQNWSPLKTLSCLTHLNVWGDNSDYSSIIDGLIPSLSKSIKIVILNFIFENGEHEEWNSLRKGELDARVVVSLHLRRATFNWVLEIHPESYGRSGLLLAYANGGWMGLWDRGMAMLRARNTALQLSY
ncbi:hypothetical protein DL96DRAFT_1677500 [Flagelloscypha sp. PMI_526]|nr:hypothetical protein DL96DRAFT_1677500 [Flagelloscypha sp. PMI_526]